jgi:hypothetical protein
MMATTRRLRPGGHPESEEPTFAAETIEDDETFAALQLEEDELPRDEDEDEDLDEEDEDIEDVDNEA